MTIYRYETHLHTAETSKCAKTSATDFVAHYKKLGYAGLFVTDHFLNGNTTVEENLSWPERIESFCLGYDLAAEKGRELGLDVFFGWEYSYSWAHFLTYGLDKDWLLKNSGMLAWEITEYFDKVHAAGGSIVHAHPFREGVSIVQLAPYHVDAVEVLNAGRKDQFNRYGQDYATSFNLPKTAGTDNHSISTQRLYGMEFPRRLAGGKDYIAAVKSGEGSFFELNLEKS